MQAWPLPTRKKNWGTHVLDNTNVFESWVLRPGQMGDRDGSCKLAMAILGHEGVIVSCSKGGCTKLLDLSSPESSGADGADKLGGAIPIYSGPPRSDG